jgi:uncharacterized protein with von Willebrand factor type A (vWA) domain
MAGPAMQTTLEDFFKALRGSDLEVGLNEQIDAGRALELVGFSDRDVLKNALGTTLAKTTTDRQAFDECFERFFAFDFVQRQTHETFNLPSILSASAALAGQSGAVSGTDSCSAGAGRRLVHMLTAGDSAGLAQTIQQAARRVGMADICYSSQKGYYIQKIQRQMGLDGIDREIAALSRQQETIECATELKIARRRLFDEIRSFVEKRLALYGTSPTRRLHDAYLNSRKLCDIEHRDFERMHDIVRKLAKRLAARHERRNKREARGRLDFRKTLRKNAACDGILFQPHWKTRVVDRPKVIAICDVSGSVRTYARFLLLFLYNLNELLQETRSFAFTNCLEEVTAIFEELPVAQAVDQVMKQAGGGTDYGQVFLDIQERLMSRVDKKTTVLILGDARNNGGAPQTTIIKLLHQRAKRVIWLNPEPRSLWGQGDSQMLHYSLYCHLSKECNSLKQLERAMDALLR